MTNKECAKVNQLFKKAARLSKATTTVKLTAPMIGNLYRITKEAYDDFLAEMREDGSRDSEIACSLADHW